MSSSTAVITGASSGIGRVYADRLARRGQDVLLVARRADELERVAEQIRSDTGRNAEVLVADLTDRDDLAGLERRIREDASITTVVNNAGAAKLAPLAEADADDLELMIGLNITALTVLSSAAAARFTANGGGTLINVASVMALMQNPGTAVYSASKSFVVTLSEALRGELADAGVRVQAVLPGATATELWNGSGIELDTLPPEIVMTTEHMVDASLAGLDAGEDVTIPALTDVAAWEAYETQRLALVPEISRKHPAERYGLAVAR